MFGFLSRNKKQYSQDVSATVPLTYNLEQALYPESNYLNFAKKAMARTRLSMPVSENYPPLSQIPDIC